MKKVYDSKLLVFFIIAFFVVGCKGQAQKPVELKHFPLDSLEGVITQTNVEIDKAVTSDGHGSLRITSDKPTTVQLFEVADIDVEKARLLYEAKIRTEGVDGNVYLEMLCHFPGKGDFFSRALQSPITATTDWTTQETPFFLKAGENPDRVKLNLVIEGTGTVWIDDIHLIKGTL